MSIPGLPRITFGMIVLNGEPYIRSNLRALYPFAHEIIVVEGACRAASSVSTPEGHSTDGTLEALRRWKEEEDRDNKLQIITRDGFWREKDEQSAAYAERATGDYLWQVDADEFYQPEQMQMVLEMLRADPAISAVSFPQITFWGGFDYVADGWYLRRGAGIYHRLFRWGKGYRYTSHRPPTVCDDRGRDVRTMAPVSGETMRAKGVFLYHYSLVFPRQVREKCAYYEEADWSRREGALRWTEEVYLNLSKAYRVHNVFDHPSWLERFRGRHPPQIEALRQDLDAGRVSVERRETADIERLLRSPYYRLGAAFLKLWDHVDRRLSPRVDRWKRRLP